MVKRISFENDVIADRFEHLSKLYNPSLAAFIMCAACNIPYDTSIEFRNWLDYTGQLKQKSTNSVGLFHEGETDIQSVMALNSDQIEKWQAIWGIGDTASPYTVSDYKRMDALFNTYSARLVSAGGYDAQQEDTLRNCSKMRLLADKALASGTKEGVSMNTQLNKTIQEALGAENLRRKDAKPIETMRVDGIVDAIRKKYGASVELTMDEAVEMCYKWAHDHNYPETMDAAEHALLAIINTMQSNNDLPALAELPPEAWFPDEVSNEFAKTPNNAELEAYEHLGLQRGTPRGFEGRQKKKRGRPPKNNTE